jgi:hypothetical protein
MTDDVTRSVDELEKNIAAFRAQMHPDAANAVIAEKVARVKAHFDADGITGSINLASPTALKDYERQVRAQYDEDLRAHAKALEAQLAQTQAALATTIAAVGALPNPEKAAAGTFGSTTEHELRQTRVVLQLDRAERQLAGRTPTQIAEAYERADDGVLRFVIEDQQRRGWPDIRLAEAPDAVGVQRLTRVIAAAQRQRVEQQHPQLVAAEAKLRTLQSATIGELFRHLRSGRGLALVR